MNGGQGCRRIKRQRVSRAWPVSVVNLLCRADVSSSTVNDVMSPTVTMQMGVAIVADFVEGPATRGEVGGHTSRSES